MLVRSSEMPPRGAFSCPSSDEPAPNGMIGVRCAEQTRTTSTTSSVDCAKTTASGG